MARMWMFSRVIMPHGLGGLHLDVSTERDEPNRARIQKVDSAVS
jgi:hypothetical protein